MKNKYFTIKNSWLFLLLLVSSISFSQTYSNPGTYSLTFPANTVVSVQVWGGGGAGGGSTTATSTTAKGGGGGGAGGYSVASFTVSGTVTFIVGAGGTGVTGGTGGTGGNSSFGTLLTSGGGAGGVGNTGGGTVAGGAVGTGNANGTAGNGGQGFTGNGISSGKGGDSGLFGTGGRALNLQYDSGDGQPGIAPGGGGGGARTSQTRPNYAGGKGGDGRIIITYCPVYTVTSTSICPGGTGVLMASASCPTGDTFSSKFPTTATALTSGSGTVTWLNPTRIFADDASNATVSNAGSSVVNSRLLNATGFGFAIPLSATIVGVEAVVGRTASDNDLSNYYVRDNSVQLIKGGTVQPTNLAVTNANWFLSTTDKIYGSQTANMWGTTLLPADVNATNFGVSLSVTMLRATANVDYIKMIVYYTIPGDINWYTAASGGTSIASGSSFNPEGVAGSGLANTNTSGTYTYYAACSSSPGCRTAVNFVINGAPTVAAITAPSALCSGGSLNPATPTVTANGSTITSQGWEMSITSGGSTYNALTVPYTVTFADNGKNIRYKAINSCGTTYSNVVVLTLNSAPSITTQPITPTPTCLGSGAQTMSVVATGSGLTYSWRRAGVALVNGGVISGQGTATLTLTNALLANTGSYDVVISGICSPSVTSNAVLVTLNSAPSITTQPITPAATCSGSGTQSMTVQATGSGLIYQWRKDGVNLSNTGVVSGATLATLTLTNPTAANAGSYTVLVSGSCTPAVLSNAVPITISSALANNNLSYTNVTSGQLNATPVEGANAILNAPMGSYFNTVNFASYGTPAGTAPNFTIDGCHSATSQSVTEGYLLGNSTATIPASNGVFGDPCNGTGKRLYVSATYTQPVCIGSSVTVVGSTPTGGNGNYTYEWQSSTTGAAGSFTAASGTNNTINYTSGALTQNIYFRRVVTSCNYSNISTIVLVKVLPDILNNSLSYGIGQSSDTPAENANAILNAPSGTYFATVNFASYGTPTGTAPNFTIGGCHSSNSQALTENALLGNSTATIPATNAVFGDPCNGTGKRLYVLATYAQPVCSGASVTINGSTPTGGNGFFNYVWESSTTSATTGFAPAAGTNNGINYTSGILTQNTYFRRVVTSCSSSTSAVVMVKVNPRPTVTNTSLTQTICSGTGSTAVSFTSGVTGTDYTWTATATTGVTGFTASGSGNIPSQTISTTATAQGTVTYVVTPSANGCPGTAVNYTILVNPLPSKPIVGAITHPTCATPTGSVALSGLPSSGTWTITRSPGNVTTSGSGTSTIIQGLTDGIYTFTVSNTSCASDPLNNVTIEGPALVIWNNGSWSSTPTIENRVEFRGKYSSETDLPVGVKVLNACSCYVTNNAEVTFNGDDNSKEGHTLNVINEVQVLSGSLTFENNASLVQENDFADNFGIITYKRNTAPVNRYDYTYWSSPVAGMTLGLPDVGLSPTTFFDKYFEYSNAWVPVPRATVMKEGRGYIIRAPQTHKISGEPKPFPATFKGKPHNGVITLPSLAGSQAHLLGNPYPSAIDADAFLNLNSSLSVPEEQRVLEGTLYFWTHNTPPSSAILGDKKYNYTTNDYATYNRTGGVGTAAKVHPLNYPAGSTNFSVPTGNIAAGQGFFAPTKARGNVVFNNAMRISGGASGTDNAQFFKLSTNSKTTTVAKTEKSRIWLNLSNSEGAFKQALIGYISGATNDYDGGFDGVSYDGNAFVDFYSVNNEKNLTIQGRTLPFAKKDSVALGYKSTIKGEFQISIDQADGVLATQNVFLEDKDLKVIHDLKKEAYTFSTEKGVFNNRFVLRYADKNAVDEVIVPEIPGQESNAVVMVSVKDGEIKINSTLTKLDKVVVYDAAGRKLFQKNNVNANVLFIPHFVWNHQVLIVDMVLIDGTKHSKKIIN